MIKPLYTYAVIEIAFFTSLVMLKLLVFLVAPYCARLEMKLADRQTDRQTDCHRKTFAAHALRIN